MKISLFLLLISLILASAGEVCTPKPPGLKHKGDPEDPNFCDYKYNLKINIPMDAFYTLFNSDIKIDIIKPSWIDYDNIGGYAYIGIAIIDKYEKLKLKL